MVQLRRERGLWDVSEEAKKYIKDDTAWWRADVAEHGLKHCALPSCDKWEASVQQYKYCSACRSVWYCSAEHGALHWADGAQAHLPRDGGCKGCCCGRGRGRGVNIGL